MYIKTRTTILNYSRFFIPSQEIIKHYFNNKRSTKFILNTNNIKVIDSVGKILLKNEKPIGFTTTHLLYDHSYLSTYAHTGKLTINFFTTSVKPHDHYKTLVVMNRFYSEKYFCKLDRINMF